MARSRKPRYDFQESPYAEEVANIMAAGEGPYTRSMLAKELSKLHPELSWREVMNTVSSVIQLDRLTKKNRFTTVSHGWYALT